MAQVAAVGALAAALALAGCGHASLSLIQLRSRAGPTCARANRHLNDIGTPTSQAGAGAFLGRGIRVMAPELAELRRLQPPKDVADVYASALGALSGELAALRQARAQLRHGADTIDTFRALQARLAPLEEQGADAWQALEVPACASR